MGINLDEVILEASTSTIAISDGTNDLAINANGSLDVNILSGINVEVDLSHVDDSVRLGDGTDLFTSTTVGADIGLDVNLINASLAVTATDLDIRDLAFATDKVDASGSEVSLDAATLTALETINAVQSGVWNIGTLTSITNDVNIADGGNSITVDAVDLDVRDLSAVQDNVAISDGTDSLAINTDGSINVRGGSDTSIKTSTATVTATAAEVLATPLAGRREVTIQNEGNIDVYIGSVVGVTSATGIKVSRNSSATYTWGEDVDIFMVAASGSQSVRFLESA